MKSILFTLFVFLNISIYAQFQEHIIESDPYAAYSIVSADIDNDGDNDILVSGGLNNQLKWIENTDGLGNFNVEHIIMEHPYLYVGSITMSDIDGDNDLDILMTTGEQDCGEIRTFKNTDGQGNFQVFSLSMYSCGLRSEIRVGDIDGDNNMDWASSVSSSEYNEPKVSWFENDGNGNVTERIIEDSYIRSFQLVDFDGDSDIDLVGFNLDSTINPEVFWYENTNGTGSFVKHLISINPYLNYYASLIVSDMDNDGDLDIIVASEGQIAWYENDGQQDFSEETYIYINNTTVNDWLEISAVDLDSDEDIDIIATGNDNTIRYYKNDGQQNFTPEIVVENQYNPYSPIYAIDINGNNKIDIISNSSENGKIAWYENTGQLSVKDNSISNFSIYPNPSSDFIQIKGNGLENTLNGEIYTIEGRIVKEFIVETGKNISIIDLARGQYILQLKNLGYVMFVKK